MSEEKEIMHKALKSASKFAVEQGVAKTTLSEDLAKIMADHWAFTYDLLKSGANLTPGKLTTLLIAKNKGIAKLILGDSYQCSIAVVVLTASMTKSVLYTTLTGPTHFAITAIELLAEVYGADQSCGVSKAVTEKFEEVAKPAHIWLENGITNWMSRGY